MSEVPPGVDLDRLQPWFAAHVDGATGGPLHASLISGGRSNLTYSVGDDAHEWVLRRPPLGHVLPTAHDMAREYTVLTALAGTDVPVPRTLAFCDDDVGERRALLRDGEGRRRRSCARRPSSRSSRPTTRAAAPKRSSTCSSRSTRSTTDAVGLAEFGHPDGYVERQVRRWGEQWERSKSRELPAIDELARRLRAALPTSPRARRSCTATTASTTRCSRPTIPAASSRCSTGRWRRSAIRSPTSACSSCTGAATRATFAGADPSMAPDAGFLTRDEVAERYAERVGPRRQPARLLRDARRRTSSRSSSKASTRAT